MVNWHRLGTIWYPFEGPRYIYIWCIHHTSLMLKVLSCFAFNQKSWIYSKKSSGDAAPPGSLERNTEAALGDGEVIGSLVVDVPKEEDNNSSNNNNNNNNNNSNQQPATSNLGDVLVLYLTEITTKLPSGRIPWLKLTVRTSKWMVGILASFWDGVFSGATLVSGRACFFFSRHIERIQYLPTYLLQ